MKNTFYSVLCCMIIGIFAFSSCNEVETFAEKKDRERDAISQYISEHNIKVISESQFNKQDSTTDVSKNEYVLFENTGVYMQIVNRGCGEMIKKGESATVLSRYTEYNITGGYIQLSNQYSTIYDKYNVYNASGTFTGTFCLTGEGTGFQSFIYDYVSEHDWAVATSAVPRGWTVPFSYIYVGRPKNGNEDVAKVRLIVPHEHGYAHASNNVFACYYEISYERGI